MPEPISPPSADILALPQESRIQLAIDAIAKAGYKPAGGQKLSTREAARIYVALLATV